MGDQDGIEQRHLAERRDTASRDVREYVGQGVSDGEEDRHLVVLVPLGIVLSCCPSQCQSVTLASIPSPGNAVLSLTRVVRFPVPGVMLGIVSPVPSCGSPSASSQRARTESRSARNGRWSRKTQARAEQIAAATFAVCSQIGLPSKTLNGPKRFRIGRRDARARDH